MQDEGEKEAAPVEPVPMSEAQQADASLSEHDLEVSHTYMVHAPALAASESHLHSAVPAVWACRPRQAPRCGIAMSWSVSWLEVGPGLRLAMATE